jgi:nitroreductase
MVLKALELAIWAPNGGNFQNWRFVYISNRNLIKTIADAVQRRVDTMGTWPEADQFGEDVKRWVLNASFFRHAPGVIAVLMSQYQSVPDLLLKERVRVDPPAQSMIDARRFANSGLQSIAAAIAYLVLALHAQGIGSVWMVGPLLVKTEIENVLKVPAGFDLAALVSFGWPDEEPTKTRKPLSEVVDFYR